jgi:hypothetical protein
MTLGRSSSRGLQNGWSAETGHPQGRSEAEEARSALTGLSVEATTVLAFRLQVRLQRLVSLGMQRNRH